MFALVKAEITVLRKGSMTFSETLQGGPAGWPAGASERRETPVLKVNLVEIQPHPSQVTHPDWWKVKLSISHADRTRTFWRWHKAPDAKTPTSDEILTWFWETTFAELHGFNFDAG